VDDDSNEPYRLGEYQLEAPLGAGGMAVTWRARERIAGVGDRLVAVKTIKPEHTTDLRFREMFFDEARISALINHRNVCQIYRAGEVDGTLFMAMEFIDGWSLSAFRRMFESSAGSKPLAFDETGVEMDLSQFHPAAQVKRIPMPVAPVLWVAGEVCQGLAA